MKKVSAAEANRYFSALLKEVAGGQEVLVTSHGEPVAQILSVKDVGPERARAKRALLQKLRSQHQTLGVNGKRDWTRDELYDTPSPAKAVKGRKTSK